MPPAATASDTSKSLNKTSEREPRPLFATLSASVTAQAAAEGSKNKTNGGRWVLNAGSVMQTVVYGLNLQRDSWGEYSAPIHLILDLATAKFAKPVIPALSDHWWDNVVGNWSNADITAKSIVADLSVYEARTPAEATVLAEAVRVKALLEQGHPWQASIGGAPENGIDDYEEVEFGQSVEVNGATVTASDRDMPLFVMRNAVISESSVCTFGADSATGPIAAASARRRGQLAASASHHSTKLQESKTMIYNLRVLLASVAAIHASLVAEHVAAAQELPEDKQPSQDVLLSQIQTAALKADLKAKDDELAALKAEKTETAKQKTKVAATATSAAKSPDFAGTAESDGDAPATVHAAMAVLHEQNPKLNGFVLRSAALKRWPELRKTIPDAVGAR